MNTITRLPAGTRKNEKNKAELFAQDGKAMAYYRGQTISFWDLPKKIILKFQDEMKDFPGRCVRLNIAHIKDINEKLEKYVIGAYGKFENTPDYDNGITNHELTGETALQESKLSIRELEVLTLFAKSYTAIEIARELFIEPTTVEVHSRHIKQKIQARNLADMIRFAIKHGLVEL